MQSVRPIDIFFIGVRILGTFLIALGAYFCLYSAIVLATYSRPVAPISLDTIAPALFCVVFDFVLGGYMFLFADTLACKWYGKRRTTVPAVFVALAGLLVLATSISELPVQIMGWIRIMSMPAHDDLAEMMGPRFFENSLECLGGLLLFLLARPLANLLDADSPEGWLYRRRVAAAVRDVEELND